MESGRNTGRNNTSPLRYWKSGTHLSSLDVESIIDDRVSTTILSFPVEEDSGGFSDIEAEFWPQRDDMIVSLMDIAQLAKGKGRCALMGCLRVLGAN